MINKECPSFSIIIATYNRSYCIDNAINSVLNQYYQNYELIIVDDGSNDDTFEKLNIKYNKYIKSRKIQIFKKEHSGLSKTRNFGINKSKNDWLIYLDSDNTMDKLYLGVYAYYILKYPTFDFFYSNFKCIKRQLIIGQKFNYNLLTEKNYIDANTICHKRILNEKLCYFNESISHSNDWELALRLSQNKVPKYINFTLIDYNDYTNDRLSNNESIIKEEGEKIQQQYLNENDVIVSTIIISYNHEKYIEKAIQSALNQCGKFKHEIIISDDGSIDSTPQLIKDLLKKCKNENVIIKNLSTKNNYGIKQNYSKCIKETTGKYVFFLEGDDYWLDNHRIEKYISFFRKNISCYMCFSKINILDETTKKNVLLDRQKNLPDLLTETDIVKSEYSNPIINLTSCGIYGNIIRASIILDNSFSKIGFTELTLAYYFLKYGKIGFIPEVLSTYRIHKNGSWQGLNDIQRLEFKNIIDQQCNDIKKIEI